MSESFPKLEKSGPVTEIVNESPSFDKIPIFEGVHQYIKQDCIPGGTHRNWESYMHHIRLLEESNKAILCDPQTSGGLLVAVDEAHTSQFEKISMDFSCQP